MWTKKIDHEYVNEGKVVGVIFIFILRQYETNSGSNVHINTPINSSITTNPDFKPNIRLFFKVPNGTFTATLGT